MKQKIIRILLSCTGVLIYAISINNLIYINIGERPVDLLIKFFEKLLEYNNYSVVYFLFEMIFIILLIAFMRKLKSNIHEIILSLFSISLISFVINITSNIIYLSQTYINFILILLILNFGLFLIVKANYVITPMDKFLYHTSDLLGITFGKIKLLTDILILFIVEVLNICVFNNNILNIDIVVVLMLSGPIIHLYEFIFDKIKIIKLT